MKEFLKLDWKKIILFVILGFIVPFPSSSCFGGWGSYCTLESSLFLLFLLRPSHLLYGYYFFVPFIVILFNYFLSCLIIQIYNKFDFLKYDWRKLIITLLLTFLSLFYIYRSSTADSIKEYRGFPIFYWKYSRLIPPPESEISSTPFTELIYLNFIMDLTFWYLLSCLIVWIYDKFRKK